jgi:hypothetical protein
MTLRPRWYSESSGCGFLGITFLTSLFGAFNHRAIGRAVSLVTYRRVRNQEPLRAASGPRAPREIEDMRIERRRADKVWFAWVAQNGKPYLSIHEKVFDRGR